MSRTQAIQKPDDYVPVNVYTDEEPDKPIVGFWDSHDQVWCYNDGGADIMDRVIEWEEIPEEEMA